MFLYPGRVPTPVELSVLQMGDVLLQTIANQSAGMWIVGTVEHQHRAGDGLEGGRIDAGVLKTDHVAPSLGVTLQIETGDGIANCATVGVEVVG